MTRLDAAREAHNEAGMALADAQSERTYGLSATRAMQALSHSLRVQGFLIDELAAPRVVPRRVLRKERIHMGRDGKGGVVMLTYLTPRQREVVLLIQQGMFARAE